MLTGTSFIPAHAFTIETKGGPKLKTEDGNFEIGINGRAHLNVHSFNRDRANAAFPPSGSQLSSDHERSGFDWRRTYMQASWFVTGKKAVYKKDRGAFGKPKPVSKWGALELAARYDLAENLDQNLAEDLCRTHV